MRPALENPSPLLLRREPLFARPRFGFVARLRLWTRAACLKQRDQPGSRRLPILRLRAMLAAVDEQHAVAGHAAAGQHSPDAASRQPAATSCTSKRSSTAVDTLLTFCPPGPDSPAAVALRGIAKGLGSRARGLAGRSLGLTPAGR